MPNRFLGHPLDRDPVAEPHLQLGGMHVHVDVGRIDGEVQQQAGAIAGMNGGTISRFRRANQEGIAKGTPVDEELGSPPGGRRVAGSLGKPRDRERTRGVVHRNQGAGEMGPHTPASRADSS